MSVTADGWVTDDAAEWEDSIKGASFFQMGPAGQGTSPASEVAALLTAG